MDAAAPFHVKPECRTGRGVRDLSKHGQKLRPWSRGQGLGCRAAVRPDKHRSLFNLFNVIRLNDVDHVEAPERSKAVLPFDCGAFALDLVGYLLCEFADILEVIKGRRRETCEDHIRSHGDLTSRKEPTRIRTRAESVRSAGLVPIEPILPSQ